MTAMDGVESHINAEENNSEIRLRKRIEFRRVCLLAIRKISED
jgi:hypothetical protein